MNTIKFNFNKKKRAARSKIGTFTNTSKVLKFPNFGLKILRSKLLSIDGPAMHYSGIVFETGQPVVITEWRLLKRNVRRHCPIPTCTSRTFDIDCKEHTMTEICSYVERAIRNTQNLRFIYFSFPHYECVSFRETQDKLIVTVAEQQIRGINLPTLETIVEMNEKLLADIAKEFVDFICLVNTLFGFDHVWLTDKCIFIENLSGRLRYCDPAFFNLLRKWAGYTNQIIDDNNWTAYFSILAKYSAKLKISTHMEDFIQYCKKTTTDNLQNLELLRYHPFLVSQPKAANMSIQSQLSIEKSRIAQDYDVIERLGQGAYGCVVMAQNKVDKKIYAIKRIGIPTTDDTLYQKILKEAEILSNVRHENVVNYFSSWIETNNDEQDESRELYEYKKEDEGSFSESETQTSDGILLETDSFDTGKRIEKSISLKPVVDLIIPPSPSQFLCIQMEYCARNTLRETIDAKLLVNQPKLLYTLAKQIVEGLAHIHLKNIIHRDLNPKNIFLTPSMVIKIGDFGLATEAFASHGPIDTTGHNMVSLTSNVGTPLYTAPEMCDPAKPKYTKQVDLYSFGVILFEMFSPPFYSGMERAKVIEALRKDGKLFPIDCKIRRKAQQLISNLLSHEPSQRPEPDEIRTTLTSIKNEEFRIRLKQVKRLKSETINSLIEYDSLESP